MLAAVLSGDAKMLAELMRQDAGVNVNQQDEDGWTLLHRACSEDRRSAVIPLLLAHPDIDVNVKDKNGNTPFYMACLNGSTSCVRELLLDSRVKVNESSSDGETPLFWAARYGFLDIIKWWIASGREMDLGKPGDVHRTDAIGAAKKAKIYRIETERKRQTEVVTLLERFKSDAAQTRYMIRVELGLLDGLAAEMFSLVVFVSDGILQINDTKTATPAATFFKIARRLPLELQMMLCFRLLGSAKEIIPGKYSEAAFKELAKKL